MKCPECGKEVDELLEVEEDRPMCEACAEKYMRFNLSSMEQRGIVEHYGA